MSKILGIDVGGTKIASGLVSPAGKVSDFRQEKTSKNGLSQQLIRIIGNYRGLGGIGLGVPGQVLDRGQIVHLPNIPKFRPVNLKKLLENKFLLPVCVNNDAKCFAYAEAVLGSGKSFNRVCGVILGTGIGVGIVINKKIYTGADGLAGEFGQFPMIDGSTLEQHVQSHGRFKSGKEAAKYLKLFVSYIVLGINPDIIIFGGAWSKLPGIKKIAMAAVKKLNYNSQVKIKISKLPHAGLVGAALLLIKPK